MLRYQNPFSRVELKCSQNPEALDVILAPPERILVSQHRPDGRRGLISILKCLKAKSYVLSLPGRVLVELPRLSTQNEANAFSLCHK
jgi:hypothetical protein